MAAGVKKFSEKFSSLAGSLAGVIIRHYLMITVAAVLLTAASVFFIAKLEIKSDFVDLLPQNFQSVKDLRRLVTKVGGLGGLDIAVESSNLKASEKFADDVVSLIKTRFKDRIIYVDYKIDNVRNYYKDNAALFMDLDDLEEVRDRVERKIKSEKLKNNPLFVDLTGDTEKGTKLDLSDIENKYKKDTKSADKYIDGYYTGENGKILAILMKPAGVAGNIPATKALLNDLGKAIDTLNPSSYAPDLKYTFGGGYKATIEEYETLKEDLLGTALLCVGLVVLALFVFFRRLRAVILLALACVSSVAWTFAITYFTIGYLNTVTAFIGAIIAGTGINYGIILLARYLEERRLGKDPPSALKTSMEQTVVATFGASLTTAVAFGVFLFSEVKSFSQFGFIGFVGVELCWISSYVFLPALIILSEKIYQSVHSGKEVLLADKLNLKFMTWPVKHPRIVLVVFTTAAMVAAVLFALYVPNSLEYDISKLRNKSSENSGTAKINYRVGIIFDQSMTPATILTDSKEEGAEICKYFDGVKKQHKGPLVSMIKSCSSIFSYIPKDQDEKLDIIRDLRRMLNDSSIGFLTDEQKRQVEDLKKTLPKKALALKDIPEEISRRFTDRDGNLGAFVFVYPDSERDLWDAVNLREFTDQIRSFQLPDGKKVTTSGEAVILSDLLRLMSRDSPIASTGAFIGVFLVVVLIFGSFRASGYVTTSLLFGSLIMLGLIAAMKIKFNFFNFVALPMTFGIGVDYSINNYQRYLLEGPGSIEKVIRRTGSAVILCSITTIIGYGTLLIADSKALVSLGMIAILGEFTCLASAMIALPAMITWMEQRKNKIPRGVK